MEAVAALDEFSFLKEKKYHQNLNVQQQNKSIDSAIVKKPTTTEKWNYDQSALEQVKEQFRTLNEDRKKNLGGKFLFLKNLS